jgi:hypothetical protein
MNPQLDPLFRDILNAQALRLQGEESHPAKRALSAVLAAYDRTLLDEEAKLPTYLHVALELARRSC